MASSRKAEGREVKKKVKYRKRRWLQKCKESIVSLFALRRKEDAKEEESRKKARRPKVRPWEDWEVVPYLFAIGAEWALCQRCSRSTAEKDGGDGEDAARSSGKSRQMSGRDPTKVETAKRIGQD